MTHETTVSPSHEHLPSPPAETPKPTLRRVVTTAVIGTFVEYYDLAVYGAVAPIMATVFFPESGTVAGLLGTFAIFAVAFFARPVGGLLWGNLGDRIGRKRTLVLVITLMSLSTLGIGLLPGYAAIGLLAPVLLVVLRLLQGLSAGGELPGATLLIAEHSPDLKRGYLVSLLSLATVASLVAGLALVALLTAVLSTTQMHDWGWRVPFIAGAAMGFIGLYIRRSLTETPTFVAAQQEGLTVDNPLTAALRRGDTYKQVAIVLGIVLPNSIGFYMLLTYMPTLLTTEMGYDSSVALPTIAIAALAIFILTPIMGKVSDSIGRRKLLALTSVLFMVLTYPAFQLLALGETLGIIAGLLVLAVPVAASLGNMCAASIERFPTSIRYTGFAIGLGVSTALFGGTVPYISTWLIDLTGSLFSPGWYLIGATSLSLITSFFMTETARRPLTDTHEE